MTDKERFKPGDKIRLINDDGTGIQTIKKVIRDGYLTTEMLRIKLKDENQWVRVDDNFESELEKQWGKYNHVDWERMQRVATLTKGDFYRIARYFMEWGKKCNETRTKNLKEEMERFFNTDEYIAGEIGVYDIASHFANWQLKLSNVERIGKNWKEEPVSEDLDEAAKIYARGEYDRKNPSSLPWQCKGCYSPLIYAFKDGANWQKQQMMKDAFVYEKKHDTAMVLASECLRNHGWFGREHDFNDLWQFICGVKELFSGEFKPNDKVKIIAIKED